MSETIVGEADPRLFQPDIMLPGQFFAALRRKTSQEPERRLVIAILQDAIECFQKQLLARHQKGRQLFEDAQGWILSEDRQWPFSFENICELLDINAEYLRAGLMAWKERQLSSVRTRGKVVPLNPYISAESNDQPTLQEATAS